MSQVRRQPEGDTAVEVLASEIGRLRRQVAELERGVWGRGRFEPVGALEKALAAVDNATDDLMPKAGGTFTGRVLVTGERMTGDNGASGSSRFSWQIGVTGSDIAFWRRVGDGLNPTIAAEMRLRPSPNRLELMGSLNLLVGGNLDVSGSKNARIADPDEDTKGYRYGADESATPGRLTHPFDVAVDGGTALVTLPEYLARIAADLRVRGPWAQGHPGSAYAGIDGDTLTVTGDDGDYLVEVVGVRADPAVEGWEHVVYIEPDPEPEPEPDEG